MVAGKNIFNIILIVHQLFHAVNVGGHINSVSEHNHWSWLYAVSADQDLMAAVKKGDTAVGVSGNFNYFEMVIPTGDPISLLDVFCLNSVRKQISILFINIAGIKISDSPG